MTLKTRRTIFYFLVLLFVIAATLVIFYSMGFRIDFKNFAVTETGGIYVRSNPSDIGIVLDGKQIKNRSGILNSGTLIDDLSPGIYALNIDFDGYASWQKDVRVLPGIVSVFDSIVLISNDGREKLMDAVHEFRFANGLLVTRTQDTIEFDGAQITGNEIIDFTDGGNVITQDIASENYYLSNISDLESSLNLTTMFNNLKEIRLDLPGAVSIVKIAPYPFDDSRFVVMTARALYVLNTDDSEIEQIGEQTDDFFVANDEVFWVNDEGLWSYGLVLGNKSLIDNSFTKSDDIRKVDASDDRLIVLRGSGVLSYIDRDSLNTTTTYVTARYFSFSPNRQLLMFEGTNGAIIVYDFEEEEDGKQLIPLVDLSGASVDKVAWYEDNAHIFVKDSSGSLKFIEIDNSTPINEVLISGDVNDFTYDNDTDSLYYGNDSGVWRLEI